MTKKEVINFFGSQTAIAKALSISQAAVSKWGDDVPPLRALQLEFITNGKLKYDPSYYCAPPASERRIGTERRSGVERRCASM